MSQSKPNKTSAVTDRSAGNVVERSSDKDLQAFLKKAKQSRPAAAGRLVFALDATMSRQPTWDLACSVQAGMFTAVQRVGGLAVQLIYFRGFGECRASKWVSTAAGLTDLMIRIDCRGGQTQIGKVLSHTLRENANRRVGALVYVGDAMEENVDRLCQMAGQLGLQATPAFLFQEGGDPVAEAAFREISRLSGGAYMRFGADSAVKLAELLQAVALFAAGGRNALVADGSRPAQLLLKQMKRD